MTSGITCSVQWKGEIESHQLTLCRDFLQKHAQRAKQEYRKDLWISGARSARDAVLDLLACILSKEVYTTEMSVYGKWTQLHWYVQLGIKHKRSDRWSAEVSYKKLAAKRYNMADTGAVEIKNDDTSSSGQNEPNLHEIKAMLVDIQISLSSIMLENKHFKKELDELKAFL